MKKKRGFSSRGYDIVVFDCDSTLTKDEGIDLLAKLKGVEKEVKILTHKAMNGEAPIDWVFPKRLSLIRPSKKDLTWLGQQYIKHQIKDAKETIKLLKKLSKKVYIVTGGYREAVEIFAEYLGVPNKQVFSVELKFGRDENYLRFDSQNPLTKNGGKGRVLQNLAKEGKTLFVGDGATDLEAKGAVDLFVGFGGVVARPIVRENADVFINCPTLLPILALARGFGI